MTPAVFAIPGDIELPTGGYMYDRRVLALLAQLGVAARHLQLPASFPDPSAADLDEAGRLLAAVAPGDVVIVDGLAYGAMPVEVIERALGTLKDQDWRLTIAGPTDRSPEALAAVRAAIGEAGLADRIALVGPVNQERLADLYASADVFLLASLYEGYGMVLAEAMARGLPIVCTTGGAAAETVPDDAAIKVPPGDERAFTHAIQRVLQDAGLRRRMADASWAAGQKLPRWEDTARIIAGVIKEVAP